MFLGCLGTLYEHAVVFSGPLTGSPGTSDAVLDAIIHGRLKSASKEPEKNDKYRKCKQLLNVGSSFFFFVSDILDLFDILKYLVYPPAGGERAVQHDKR